MSEAGRALRKAVQTDPGIGNPPRRGWSGESGITPRKIERSVGRSAVAVGASAGPILNQGSHHPGTKLYPCRPQRDRVLSRPTNVDDVDADADAADDVADDDDDD